MRVYNRAQRGILCARRYGEVFNMRCNQQLPIGRLHWQARPGERELRRVEDGARGFDPTGHAPLSRGEKGGR